MSGKSGSLDMVCPPFPCYISSGQSVFNPGEVHAERIFPVFVAMFVTEGEVYFTEGETAYTLQKGEWFIQTPGLRHFGHKPSQTRAAFYWVHFMPLGEWNIAAVKDETEQRASRLQVTDTGEGFRVPAYGLRIPMHQSFPVEEWSHFLSGMIDIHGANQDPMHAQSLFMQLIGMLLQVNSQGNLSGMDRLADSVKDYIRANYRGTVTVRDIAVHFHFAADYISRCFRKRFHTTPRDFMQSLRMAAARDLLINSSKPVKEIAREVGYEDLAVFSRMFSKTQGMSPSRYRRRIWDMGSAE